MEVRLQMTKGPLSYLEEEVAISTLKMIFEKRLCLHLNLTRVSSPLFVHKDSGVQDNLGGTERPVSFQGKCFGEKKFEIVHSLAKWKRYALKTYEMKDDTGIITDMKALRPDEEKITELHSIYVDQWDWEKVIPQAKRTYESLQETVRLIYRSLKETEKSLTLFYPHLTSFLPEDITFVSSEELLKKYPHLTPKEREYVITKEHGAVFLQGIGGKLSDGTIHDGRAPDYDDWSTPFHMEDEVVKGLNGDILIYSPVIDRAVEISSMGIRVDATALKRQVELTGSEDRLKLPWHQMLLEEKLPQSIGGGIGQSRVAMLLLQKKHIGEVQVSVWPEDEIL